MNPFTSNLSAGRLVAEQTIADRVHDAERRTEARNARREIRAARRQARQDAPAVPHHLPAAAFRFLHPVH
jgi:hypothetical protein